MFAPWWSNGRVNPEHMVYKEKKCYAGGHCDLIAWGRRGWVKMYEGENHSVVSDSLWPHGSYILWNSPGQNIGVGSLSFLQQIFLTQGLNPGLPHCKWILYQLSHNGSPKMCKHLQIPPHPKLVYDWGCEPCLLSNWKGLFCSLQLLLVFWSIKMVFC